MERITDYQLLRTLDHLTLDHLMLELAYKNLCTPVEL